MRRYLILFGFVAALFLGAGIYQVAKYWWVHQYDEIITRQAGIYRLEKEMVWSVIYEETFFRSWKIGSADEVGLMQVTPTVAKEWAKDTGFGEFERKMAEEPVGFLRDPERNIQIGCRYLEKLNEKYSEFPAEKAMTLAAYNAGPSRVEEWTKGSDPAKLSEQKFIEKIAIPSTKSYVTNILDRYREHK